MSIPGLAIDLSQIITTHANSEGNANNWGSNKTPYCITPDGTEWYAWQGSPSDNSDIYHAQVTVPWILATRSPGGNWTQYDVGPPIHREKPTVMTDPTDPHHCILFCWKASLTDASINGQPYEYRSKDKSYMNIPGNWYGFPDNTNTNWDGVTHPYAAGGRMPDGRSIISRLAFPPGTNPQTPNVPGLMQWTVREVDGSYNPVMQFQMPFRVAYNFFEPTPDGQGMNMGGTRDVTWAELGLVAPSNFGYAFDMAYAVHWSNIYQQPTLQKNVRQMLATQDDWNVWYSLSESYMDLSGKWHWITAGHGPESGQVYFGEHIILDPYSLTTIKRITSYQNPAALPLPYQNIIRMQQEPNGTFWLWSYFQNQMYVTRSLPGDTDGTLLDSVTIVPIPNGALSDSGNQWKAARNGSPDLITNGHIKSILMEVQAQYPTYVEIPTSGAITPMADAPTLAESTITPISDTSAIIHMQVLTDGGKPILDRGLVWALNSVTNYPQLTDVGVTVVHFSTEGLGLYSILLEGLPTGVLLALNAYAANEDKAGYAPTIQFTMPIQISGVTQPSVSAPVVSGISQTQAIFNASVTDTGGAGLTEAGFVYAATGAQPNPAIGDPATQRVVANSLNTSVSNLAPNIQYSVRAYAINSVGIGYSQAVTFRTLPTTQPPPPVPNDETPLYVAAAGLVAAIILFIKGRTGH